MDWDVKTAQHLFANLHDAMEQHKSLPRSRGFIQPPHRIDALKVEFATGSTQARQPNLATFSASSIAEKHHNSHLLQGGLPTKAGILLSCI